MNVDEQKEHEDRYYIVAGPAPPDARTLVLKDEDAFGVFNQLGDIDHRSNVVQGLFAEDMRHLSRLNVRLDGQALLLLSSRVTMDNSRIIVDLTNPDMTENEHLRLRRGTIHLARSIFLYQGACFERMTLTNYDSQPARVLLSIEFACDFADIFEVRGVHRTRRGTMLPVEVDRDVVLIGYQGLDDEIRRTRIHFHPPPQRVTNSKAAFELTVLPLGRSEVDFCAICEPAAKLQSLSYRENAARCRAQTREERARYCSIESPSEYLNAWIRRSLADVRTLMTNTDQGPYPYAGIPWFSAPFGRDGIVTAMQLLWVNPDIARGALGYLAAMQADHEDSHHDAEPGKILHERRTDEMARTGEVPFGRYYGSVDATPLFIMLAGEYFDATADVEFIRSKWSNIERALEWIDRYGDSDGDGFVEYKCKASEGLANQGWKDSHDSVFHADGSLAEGPIALCEVQGYVYAAKLRAAKIARAMGELERADALESQAQKLKKQFNEAFWREDIEMFALALDGDKQPCAVRTSNAGQTLFTGIVEEEYARRIRDQMLSRSMYSGWGIRTVASTESRYNPMSYHNGSIWPHDNGLIAAGFAKYGFRDAALAVFHGWFNASTYLELHRLPELCCGFRRRVGKGPTLYPVACSPQAWAAGSVFMMLAACLGLSIDGGQKAVHIHRPELPRNVSDLRIRGLRLNDGEIDLMIHRTKRDVGVLVLGKTGPVDVVVTK